MKLLKYHSVFMVAVLMIISAQESHAYESLHKAKGGNRSEPVCGHLGIPDVNDKSSVTALRDGGVCATGFLRKDHSNRGGYAVVTCFSKSMRSLWTVRCGKTGDNTCTAITSDFRGNLYVSGHSWNKNEESDDASDAFIIKYNSKGKQIWKRNIKTRKGDEISVITIGPMGSIYVAGYTEGSLPGHKNKGYADVFVARYRQNGKRDWIRQWGSKEDEFIFGMDVDEERNLYVTGYTMGLLKEKNSGKADMFAASFTSGGKQRWMRQWGDAKDNIGRSIAVHKNGNLYLTDNTPQGLTALCPKDGHELFRKALDCGTKAEVERMSISKRGTLYLAGKVTQKKEQRLFLASFTPEGERQWMKQLTGKRVNTTDAMAVDRHGTIYLTGTEPHTEDDRVFLMKIE